MARVMPGVAFEPAFGGLPAALQLTVNGAIYKFNASTFSGIWSSTSWLIWP
jgi:hypothetical protein